MQHFHHRCCCFTCVGGEIVVYLPPSFIHCQSFSCKLCTRHVAHNQMTPPALLLHFGTDKQNRIFVFATGNALNFWYLRLLEPTKAACHHSMEAVLTVLTYLIHGGKKHVPFRTCSIRLLIDPQLFGIYSELMSIDRKDRKGFIWLYIQNFNCLYEAYLFSVTMVLVHEGLSVWMKEGCPSDRSTWTHHP